MRNANSLAQQRGKRVPSFVPIEASWLETFECCHITFEFSLIDDRFIRIIGSRFCLRLGTKTNPEEEFPFTIRRAVMKACSDGPRRKGEESHRV